MLSELCDLTIKDKDHATYSFLQWFVQEQIEEESIKKFINSLED